MNVFSISVNFRRADVDLRGRLAVPESALPEVLCEVTAIDGIAEAVLLNTCNRLEIYAAGAAAAAAAGPETLVGFLAEYRGIPEEELQRIVDRFGNEETVRHVFRVASALDSMVPGETQILGQIKTAYARAVEAGTTGPQLHYLFQRAFALAKKVRRELKIGTGRVSVASIAVDAAADLFGGLADREVMVIGTGKMGRVTLRYLQDRGAGRVWIVSRTRERARETAEALGQPAERCIDWSQIDEAMRRCDIVVTSTNCPVVILGEPRLRAAMKGRADRPMLVIDLAVPRDVDPEAAGIPGIHILDLDRLGKTAEAGARRRKAELAEAYEMVDRNVETFLRKVAIREAKRAAQAAGS